MNNARVVGRLVVTTGRHRLEQLLGGLGGDNGPAPPEPAVRKRSAPAGAAAHPPVADSAEADVAIPDYRALSASQVVRRLDSLGPDELEALYRFEAATRGRRTILHRVQQLLGREEPPAPPSSAD